MAGTGFFVSCSFRLRVLQFRHRLHEPGAKAGRVRPGLQDKGRNRIQYRAQGCHGTGRRPLPAGKGMGMEEMAKGSLHADWP